MFKKILIANRGEIALRVIRACKEMGIQTVAVYSTADINSLHVRMADESICIGGPSPKESYLKMDNIISAAHITGAEAIHPGVGFLSENALFAQMIEDHGIAFIGPSSEHIRIMADKIQAKKTMADLGVPLIPGSEEKIKEISEAKAVARSFGYPVLIKAASGGGGKGMQIVYQEDELESKLKLAQMEAQANFGDNSVFIEKYLQSPRHIEVQVLCDHYGKALHLGERDCSIQRRHQKVWEEAPSPVITPEQRAMLGGLSAKAMEKMGYRGVGTLEFLYENGQFYFMEMNTRIQVEHPITEMITGIDLIKQQIMVASGQPLTLNQEDIVFKGHAIECRINAEDPENFAPWPGVVSFYHPPGGMGVRVDSHLYHGYKIPPYYDSLISKLIVHGPTRRECMITLNRALDEYVIDGVRTLIPLHKKLVQNPDIIAGQYDVPWLTKQLEREQKKDEDEGDA